MMQDAFFSLSDALLQCLQASEDLLLHLSGERTDFVSFNHGRIRQAGEVERQLLGLRLVQGGRVATWRIALSGEPAADLAESERALAGLREILPSLPPDPFLCLPDEPMSSELKSEARLPPTETIVQDFLRQGEGLDMVGLLASGTIQAGFAGSSGQKNWFQRQSFALDWSVHTPGRPAAKHTLAGFIWDPELLEGRMRGNPHLEEALSRPSRTLEPGRYRAYLEPPAVGALLELLSKDGFSARAWRRKTGCLSRALRGEPLSEFVTWKECSELGPGPSFDAWGFQKPESLVLFERGRPVHPLVSPRSASEFGLVCTGAGDWEQPDSLVMPPGEIPAKDSLLALGTGVWICRLHYLSPSDFSAGRFTGLTRFAAFWVENGRPIAPIDGARIEDGFLEVFGPSLAGLTQEQALLPDTGTIEERSTRFIQAPGAILNGLTFT